MSGSGGSQWISSNLSLTGFSGTQAAFMTCKELVENAFDAVKQGEVSPRIRLHIESDGDFFIVTCEDSGSGFHADSVEALSSVFTSTRAAGSHVSAGKFGVGLKAVAIMSHLHCDQREVTVQSKVSDSFVEFRIACDESHDVHIKNVHLSPLDPSHDCCTRVSVSVPAPADPTRFLSDLESYLRALSFLNPTLSISLALNDEDPLTLPDEPNASKTICHQDPSGILDCHITLDTSPGNTDTARHISLTRYVNGVPLITSNMGACTLFASTSSVLSKLSPSLGIDLGPSSTATIVSTSIPITSSPIGSSWSRVAIRVNLKQLSRNIDYNCLSKDGVVGVKGFSASLIGVVSRCTRLGLKKMQGKWKSQFQSAEDFERKMAVTKYIPSIALNLTRLILQLRNEAFVGRAKELLGQATAGGAGWEERDVECLIVKLMVNALGNKENANLD